MTTRRTLTAALALTLSLGTAVPALATTQPTTPLAASTSDAGTGGEAEALTQQLVQLLDAQLPGAINPADYACSTTSLRTWRSAQMRDLQLTPAELQFLGLAQTLVLTEGLAMQPDGPQYYGLNGEYTKELDRTFTSLGSFWDTEDEDPAALGALHGSVLTDEARLRRFLTSLGAPDAFVNTTIGQVRTHLANPKFRNGDHPLFSLNAVAYSDGLPQNDVPDKILVGDGMLEAMSAVGLRDVAPRGILAHEYGHLLQYELDLMGAYETTPEATRELELEADALGAYYLSHPRGERLRQQRVEAFVETFAQTGDCGFASKSHHGTPNQRVAAARWGDALANEKGAMGHILTAERVSDQFRDHLSTILLPDAPVTP